MSLLRDKISRAIESLNNDERDWRGFTLAEVAQKAHDLIEPEMKALLEKNAELEAALGGNSLGDNELSEKVKGLTATVQESVNSIAELNEDLSKANALNEEQSSRIKDLEEGIIEFMDSISASKDKAVKSASEELAKLVEKKEDTE